MHKSNKTRQFGDFRTQPLGLELWDCLFHS
jgi:hypothetical protein